MKKHFACNYLLDTGFTVLNYLQMKSLYQILCLFSVAAVSDAQLPTIRFRKK
jgi:hypothetical protein